MQDTSLVQSSEFSFGLCSREFLFLPSSLRPNANTCLFDFFVKFGFRVFRGSCLEIRSGSGQKSCGGLRRFVSAQFRLNLTTGDRKTGLFKRPPKTNSTSVLKSFSPSFRARWAQIRPGNWRRAARLWGQFCLEDGSRRSTRKPEIANQLSSFFFPLLT